MANILPPGTKDEEKLLEYGTPEKIGRLGVQTWYLRPIAFGLAIMVIIAFGYLEYVVLSHLLTPCNQVDVLFVVLAVSPIVAVTAIVIFLLIGVFRGYRNADMGHLPLETILKGLGDD